MKYRVLKWFLGKSRRVIDGPYTETKKLVAGLWLIQREAEYEIEIRPAATRS